MTYIVSMYVNGKLVYQYDTPNLQERNRIARNLREHAEAGVEVQENAINEANLIGE